MRKVKVEGSFNVFLMRDRFSKQGVNGVLSVDQGLWNDGKSS